MAQTGAKTGVRWLPLCVMAAILVTSHSQLVLDDVVEEGSGGGGLVKEASDPMTATLQWAVDNSDQNFMAQRAQRIREGKEPPMKLDREVMDALFGSKISFLQKSVDALHKAIAEGVEDDIVEALEMVEEQATDIDNANDLDRIDGVEPTIRLLSHSSSRVRAAALWLIGTAAQSNPAAQEMLMNYRALPIIMAPMVELNSADSLEQSDPKLLAKTIYAISTLLRGCGQCIETFQSQEGPHHLSKMLSIVSRDTTAAEGWLPVKRKLVALVGDLVMEEVDKTTVAKIAEHFAAVSPKEAGHQDTVSMSIARLLAGGDRELLEKSMQALINVMSADARAADAMMVAGLPDVVGVVVKNAAERMQGGEEDGSWEEPLLLGQQLLQSWQNRSQH